jgi:hypothetical protein
MALTSSMADLFLEQRGAEQRRLVLDTASWQGGELRTPFREPLSELILSNRVTQKNNSQLSGYEQQFWYLAVRVGFEG